MGIFSWLGGLFGNKPQQPTPALPPVFKLPPEPTVPSALPSLSIQQQLLDAHNANRASDRPLRLNTPLCAIATRYASLMAEKRTCSHTLDGLTLFQRFKADNYSASTAGENIAAGQRDVAAVMKSWINSAGHRSNIRNPDYSEVGFGVCADSQNVLYWCVDFARPAVRTQRLCTVHVHGGVVDQSVLDVVKS